MGVLPNFMTVYPVPMVRASLENRAAIALAARMVHQLHSQTDRVFQVAPERLFAAIKSQKMEPLDRNKTGAILAVTPIWGAPATVGHQVLIRLNAGEIDLEIIEYTLVVLENRRIRIRQRPDRFLYLDPSERSMKVDAPPPLDLAAEFRNFYGDPPATTEVQFDLAAQGDATLLSITAEVFLSAKPGWFKKTMWRRFAQAETNRIMGRIEAALA